MKLYSKDDCELCAKAIEYCKIHNIYIEVNKVRNKYEILQRHTSINEDELMDVKMFPIFVTDESKVYDFDGVCNEFGEMLLNENENRHVLFPIKYPSIWDCYEKAVASFWTANEINFASDDADFKNMTDNERHFIKYILAFFAAADGIVNENLAVNFSNEVQIPEARAFYSYQQFNETIHSQTYSLMIDTYVHDLTEKQKLFDGVHTIPSVGKKAKWALKWINKENNPCFAKRLVAFACVEGVMFSGSFCAIFWLKKRGLMHGLSFSNELISRDEGTHQEFAAHLYSFLKNKLNVDEVVDIITEAVKHEQEFIIESIPCRLIGMNEDLMKEYIEYVADRLMLQLGYGKHYHTKNPFDFMETISLSGKTNFFERRVGEYARPNLHSEKSKQEFSLDATF